MKDLWGVDLEVGQKCAASVPAGDSRDLIRVEVVGFTPHFVKVRRLDGSSYQVGQERRINPLFLAVKTDG